MQELHVIVASLPALNSASKSAFDTPKLRPPRANGKLNDVRLMMAPEKFSWRQLLPYPHSAAKTVLSTLHVEIYSGNHVCGGLSSAQIVYAIPYRQALWDTSVVGISLHGGGVTELRLRKPESCQKGLRTFNGKAGQYCYLNIPDLARFEWHPFSLTSGQASTILSNPVVSSLLRGYQQLFTLKSTFENAT